jgi:hypothetical protein
MVDRGDRRDDREAQSEAVVVGAATQPVKGLEEATDGLRGDDGTGVRDDEGDPTGLYPARRAARLSPTEALTTP